MYSCEWMSYDHTLVKLQWWRLEKTNNPFKTNENEPLNVWMIGEYVSKVCFKI